MEVKKGHKAFWILLLCIPIAFIVYFAVTHAPNGIDIDSEEIENIELQFPNGETIIYDLPDDISFYTDIISHAVIINEPLREFDDTEAVTVICKSKETEIIYKIYPELSVTGCMLTNNKEIYLLDETGSKNMLMRPEYEYLYSVYYIPRLTLNTGNFIYEAEPAQWEWQYKKIDGEFVFYEKAPVQSGEIVSVYSNRSNSIAFEKEPDFLIVEFTDEDGNILQYNNFEDLIFPNERILKAEIKAEWNKESNLSFYGSATYSIEFLYDIPATVTLSQNTVTAGKFVVINASHLSENENVEVISDDFKQNFVFTPNNGIKTAVFAVPLQTEPGEYSLQLKIGDNKQTFSITVLQRNEGEFERYTVSSQLFDKHLGEESVNELYGLINELTKASEAQFFTDPQLPCHNPAESGELVVPYGTEVMLNLDGSVDSHTIISACQVYTLGENGKIRASKNGKIVYTGETKKFGNTIAIDHGCGILTWYTGFGSFTKNIGETVSAGDILGTVGTGIFSDNPYTVFFVTASGIFTDGLIN